MRALLVVIVGLYRAVDEKKEQHHEPSEGLLADADMRVYANLLLLLITINSKNPQLSTTLGKEPFKHR